MVKVDKGRMLYAFIILLIAVGGWYITRKDEAHGVLGLSPCSGTLTVLYDNYQYDQSCQSEWGFSCLIETEEVTVLFDTGGEADVLAYNVDALGVDLSSVDCVVISHEHWDHVGGLSVILEERPGIPVYVPDLVPYLVKSDIRSMGGEVVETDNSTVLSAGIAITSVHRRNVPEQALMICTDEGTILVTGCSHPGVENFALEAAEALESEIRLVIGGFHLGSATEFILSGIIDGFDEAGVQNIAPTHCTGDNSIEYLREHYGDQFIEVGAGFRLEF